MHKNTVFAVMSIILALASSACLALMPVPIGTPKYPQQKETQAVITQQSSFTATAPALHTEPTITASITTTAFPSITPLPTSTGTATPTPYGFVASPVPTEAISATAESQDPDEGATDGWGSTTRCSLLEKSPSNWAILKPREEYKISWTLLNSGTKTWQASDMMLAYQSGAKLTRPDQKKQNLLRDVKVGQTITPVIKIYTPKEPGSYRSVWGLRLNGSNRFFCTFTIKIIVQ